MFEVKVLSAFIADRKDYDLAEQYLSRDKLSPYAKAFVEAIDDYYKRDHNAEAVDLEVLRMKLERKYADIPKNLEKMQDFYRQVVSVDSSKVNVITEVIEQRRSEVRLHLVDAMLAQDEKLTQELLLEYEKLTDATTLERGVEEEYQGMTLDELEEKFQNEGVWDLSPKELGDRIASGLRPGHSVVIAARPERGKTLFAVNAAGGFLIQGAKVLYIGNEDPVPDLVMRLLSNLSGMPADKMLKFKEEAMERALAKGYDNCVFAGLSPGSLYEVEALVRRHKPDVVIVDQMRNIKANTENNTQRLEVVAQEIRNIGRRNNCLMVSMTQVGDSGRNKLVLNDGDIDGSNTGIPGACDVIVMIGSDEEYELRDWRMVTLAKNKRGGNHDSFTVSVDRKLSRVVSKV